MARPMLVTIVGLALAVMGCGQSAPETDNSAACAALREALDSWKQGKSLAAYRETSSSTIVDRQWEQGVKLLDYTVNGDGEPSGYDVQFTVQLSLHGRNGKRFSEKALYVVSTSPKLVVIRSE